MKTYPVRSSAKAIIFHRGAVLAMKIHRNNHIFYILPGGGQNHNENLVDAVSRECREEFGGIVEVGDLVMIRDYIADHHEFADQSPGFHQVEHMFLCSLLNPDKLEPHTEADTHQVGWDWIPVNQIMDWELYPRTLRGAIAQLHRGEKVPVYTGDVN